MVWYERLPVPRKKSFRIRAAAKYGKDIGKNRAPITIRDEKQCFWKAYCKKIYLQGFAVKVCSRYHIAKFFDVPLSTIHNWTKHGVMPEPFMYQQGPQGQYPVYLAAQMRVLLVVLRDLAAEGYVSIPWGRLPDHVAMLHKGYKAVRKSFDARNSNEPYDGEGDRYGVVLLD